MYLTHSHSCAHPRRVRDEKQWAQHRPGQLFDDMGLAPEHGTCAESCGMPSSHAAMAVSLFILAITDAYCHFNGGLMSGKCFLFSILLGASMLLPVPFSRVFLHDHYPKQVLVGSTLAVLYCFVMLFILTWAACRWQWYGKYKKPIWSIGRFVLFRYNSPPPVTYARPDEYAITSAPKRSSAILDRHHEHHSPNKKGLRFILEVKKKQLLHKDAVAAAGNNDGPSHQSEPTKKRPRFTLGVKKKKHSETTAAPAARTHNDGAANVVVKPLAPFSPRAFNNENEQNGLPGRGREAPSHEVEELPTKERVRIGTTSHSARETETHDHHDSVASDKKRRRKTKDRGKSKSPLENPEENQEIPRDTTHHHAPPKGPRKHASPGKTDL